MKRTKTFFIVAVLLVILSCIQDDEFSIPSELNQELEEPVLSETRTTFKALKERFEGSRGIATFGENESIYIEGYVISSDEKGNFFKELIVQNKTDGSSSTEDPRMGLRIDLDQSGLFSKYGIGRKIYIKLSGLSITKDNGVLALGKLANGEFGRIPSTDINDIIIRSPQVVTLTPKATTIKQLSEIDLNTLIQIKGVQFTTNEIGKTFAGEATDGFDGERLLESCDNAQNMLLSSSSFSDFVSEVIPEQQGDLIAVYTRDFFDEKDVLLIREPSDLVFNSPRCKLTTVITPNYNLKQLIAEYNGSLIDLGLENLVVACYVISSDEEKNITQKIVVQDAVRNPESGIQLLIEAESLFQKLPLGSEVYIKLNGLAMGLDKEGSLSLGFVDNGKIVAIPTVEMDRFIINTNTVSEIQARDISIFEIANIPKNTLVRLQNMELSSNENGAAYAYYNGTESAERNLINCSDLSTIKLINNGEATFANHAFPEGNGDIVAILNTNKQGHHLSLRQAFDINFNAAYQDCSPTSISNAIIFSEFADPNNDTTARFIELYNAGEEAVNISGWKILRYTNESTTVSNELVLDGILFPQTTYVISPNAQAFNAVYGFAPDYAPTNAIVADGNGDDNYQLVNANGSLVDVFGVVGEDGSNTNHEFEDGRALRLSSVLQGNTSYTFSEWQVWNDTGLAGTILLPQDAPAAFTPGVH
jgi:hypothetical protein